MAIIMTSPTQSVTVVLAGAKTANDAQFVVAYEDVPVGAQQGGPQAVFYGTVNGTTNGTAAVTVLTGPPTGLTRRITEIDFNNADTGSITPTFKWLDSVGTVSVPFWKITRATLEQSIYTQAGGWQQYSAAGAKQ